MTLQRFNFRLVNIPALSSRIHDLGTDSDHIIEWFVDVEDAARLHVVALLCDQVQSERLFAFASPFTWADIAVLLRKLQPDNPLIPAPPKNEERIWNQIPPVARAEGLLQDVFGRAGWTPLEESLAAGVRSFT